MVEQFVCGKELRIAANHFLLVLRRIGEEHKILYHTQQSLFPEQAFYHCQKGIDTVCSLIVCLYFSPRIKEVVRRKQRPIFVVHSVADDHKGVVSEQVGNVATIAHGELCIGIHDGCVFLHGTLEFQYHYGQTVHINNAVWDAPFQALYLQLVDDAQQVILYAVFTKIYRLDKQIRQSRILTLQRKAFRHQPIGVAVLFIQREAHIGGQHGKYALNLQRRNAVGFVSAAQIQAHIVPKQDIAHFFMDFFSIGIYVILLLEQFHDR